MNKAILIGRLTRDPELRYTSSNRAVCQFTVAIDRRFQRQGEEKQADFISCVAWQKTAEFISKYFKKGSCVCICGSIQTRTWEADGQKRYATEVIADEVYFVDSKSDNAEPEPHFEEIGADSDLPF